MTVTNFSNFPGLPLVHPLNTSTATSALVRAAAGVRAESPPIWFMRQAGRSLPEYREIRRGTTMLEACLTPDLAAEITLQPVRRHNVDAAIFFSDIVVPLKLAGVAVEIVADVGPVLDQPIRTAAAVANLQKLTADSLAPISIAVGAVVAQLGDKPLIGFAGAPFTLASYMIEGKPSRDYLHTKALMYSDPETWDALLTWAADLSGQFLRAQVLAGASVVQLFDSWAGALSLPDYVERVMKYSARVFGHLTDLGIPKIHFGVNSGELLGAMRDVGADVIGVDHRLPLDVASQRLGASVPLQGNIEPGYLFAPWETLRNHVDDVIVRGRSAPSHILNLGHGVPPTTDPDVLTRIVAYVHGEE